MHHRPGGASSGGSTTGIRHKAEESIAMLVLGRNTGDKERSEVVLRSRGDGRLLARIIVMSAGKNGRVRLGFECGDDIVILRKELEAPAAAKETLVEVPTEPTVVEVKTA